MADVSSEDLPGVEASLVWGSPRELNRQPLSALRRVERRTRWRAEWTAIGDTARFFDYVPKGIRPATGTPRRPVT